MPIRDYSQTAASNTAISSINIGEGCPPSNINDAIRQALADVRELQANSTIASAATVNIGAANAEYLAVSGTTTITAFDSVAAGVYRVLKFDGALTLTHNATSLILPSSANITTAAGDVAGFRSLGSGNWRCEWYQRASGAALAAGFPTGGIVMWSGSIVSIPSGWYLCDGTNGTPDLRDRFVVGAGSTYSVAGTGGSKDAIVVSHTHTATVTDPGHAHVTRVGGTGTTFQRYGSGSTALAADGNTDSATTGITVSNSTEGSSGTNANLPPYYALAYIMKA